MSLLIRLSIGAFSTLVLLGRSEAQTSLPNWYTIGPGFTASFNKPSVNDAGQTAYLAPGAFVLGVPGTPAQRNLQAFLESAGLGLDVAYCVVGDNGRVGYMLERGLIDDFPGAGQILASENGQVPSLPTGVQFHPNTFSDSQSIPWHFAMSPSGVFVLSAVLNGTGVITTGTSNINDQVVLRGPAGDFKAIVRAADVAPGLPAGYVFVGQQTRRFDAVINRSGTTAIRTRATQWKPGFPFPSQNAEGIWLHDPVGGLQLAVTAVSQGTNPRGDTAPGTDGGRFTDITLGPAINDQGYIAFAANTFNFAANPPSKSGIWSGPTNDLQPVHLFAAPVPGLPGVTFDTPFNNASIKLGTGRTVCFTTALAGAGVTSANNVGMFIGTSTNDVRLLARIGAQAPGLPDGVNFASIPGDAVVLFGTNRVAIRAFISGPGVSAGVDDKGLWITDDQGNLQLVARLADTIHTDLGDKVMGGDFLLQHGTGQDGLSSSGNRHDQLAVYNNGFVNASYAYLLNIGSLAPVAPVLNYSLNRGSLTLSWPAGYTLQYSATLPPTTWSDFNVASPFNAPMTNQQAFYRLSPQ